VQMFCPEDGHTNSTKIHMVSGLSHCLAIPYGEFKATIDKLLKEAE
jgi:hypothetical protein